MKKNNKIMCVWDAATGAVEQTLVGHSDAVTSVAFNHDGTKIVSGSDDNKVSQGSTTKVDRADEVYVKDDCCLLQWKNLFLK